MSFSLFSSKKSSDQARVENVIKAPAVVRTMRNDIEDVKHGGKGLVFTQSKQAEGKPHSPQSMLSEQLVNPFSKEGEKLFQIPAVDTEKKPDNPFGVASQSKRDFPGKFSQQPNMKNGLAPAVLGGELLSNQLQRKKNVFLISSIVVIILLLVSGGAYYYFFVSGKRAVELTQPGDGMQSISGGVAQNPPKELPYALDKPNYLSINTETVSPLDIRNTLAQTSSRIKEASISQPVEFLVTDQNNNPLAFSRFAFLLKLGLTSGVLSLVDEAFSLYIYNDAGSMRLGLDLTLKDQPAVLLALSKIESTLPYAFQALLLEPNVSVPKTIAFKSNVYNNGRSLTSPLDTTGGEVFGVRYANIDVLKNYSIDYTIGENSHWYIGTSKNTLRVILDVSTK